MPYTDLQPIVNHVEELLGKGNTEAKTILDVLKLMTKKAIASMQSLEREMKEYDKRGADVLHIEHMAGGQGNRDSIQDMRKEIQTAVTDADRQLKDAWKNTRP